VPEAGLEPAQPQWPGDFKSPVSTNFTTRALFHGIWAPMSRTPQMVRKHNTMAQGDEPISGLEGTDRPR
jgi:hypothetical protein